MICKNFPTLKPQHPYNPTREAIPLVSGVVAFIIGVVAFK
jgi:hypothetical protein